MLKLSLGDARAYYLSTAKNELGVVSAQSIAGKLYVATELGMRQLISVFGLGF